MTASYNGLTDAFVIKVNPATSGRSGCCTAPTWAAAATTKATRWRWIAAARSCLTGCHQIERLPTKNAYQGSNAGGQDAVVTAIDIDPDDPARMLYSTYLGGSATTMAMGSCWMPRQRLPDRLDHLQRLADQDALAIDDAGDHDAILTEINPAADRRGLAAV